jgi:hypothetical protein
LVPKDIDNTIKSSLHLSQASENGLTHALNCGGDEEELKPVVLQSQLHITLTSRRRNCIWKELLSHIPSLSAQDTTLSPDQSQPCAATPAALLQVMAHY